MDNLFRPDAFLWRWCSRILDIMVLSILWFFCSLPAVTTGAASAALYDAAVHGIRRDEPGAYARFLRTFRRELRIAVPVWLVWGTVAAGLLWCGQLIGTAVQEPGPVRAAATALVALLFLVLGTLSWIFPLLSRFQFSFRTLNRTAWQFCFAHLPSSLALVVLLSLSAWGCVRFLFPVFFVPCTEALLASFLIERAFQKHLPQEIPENSVENR